VVREFLEEEKSLVGINKKKGSWRCVKGHLTNHLLGFVGEKTPLVDVKREKWMEYYHYRKEQKSDIVNTTLLNEKYSIGSFYHFCVDKKYLDTTYLPKFVKIDSESRRRQHFTETEWKKIYSFFTTNEWKNPENDRIKELRLFVRDFIIILMNTGLRKGELKRVRWENVSIEKNKGKIDRKLSVRITLDKTQTKTKKQRVVIGRRGDVFERIRGYSNYTGPNDLVFVNNDTGNPIPDRYYYRELNFLIKSIGFDKTRRDNGFYCCRHSYITWRLLRGVDILSLSKNVGTSILMIQKFYEHVLMEMVGTELVKDKDLSDTGVLIFD
jgi:integrase